MTLTRVPDGWLLTADRTLSYRVSFVDDLLPRAFDRPGSDNEPRSLDGVVVVDRFLMRHPVHGPAIRAWLARHGITPHFVLVNAARASQEPGHEGSPT